MLKLAAASKNAGNSFLNKTWTILIMILALVFSVYTFFFPGEAFGLPRKQIDSAFAMFIIGLTLVGMVVSGKDKTAQLESEIEGLMRKSQKPSVTEGFSIKLLTYILGTPDEIANLLENAELRTQWDP